jgi:hypothetical protein
MGPAHHNETRNNEKILYSPAPFGAWRVFHNLSEINVLQVIYLESNIIPFRIVIVSLFLALHQTSFGEAFS